jgi:hypothetical protein
MPQSVILVGDTVMGRLFRFTPFPEAGMEQKQLSASFH